MLRDLSLQQEILGSESFTRWLVWGTSASARELGKIRKFLHPHHLRVHKVENLVGFECPFQLTLSAPL